MQPVGDEDHCATLIPLATDQAEETVDVVDGERRGGLVENQDPALSGDDPGHLGEVLGILEMERTRADELSGSPARSSTA